MSDINRPPDQPLNCEDMFAVVTHEGTNPPTCDLTFDVTHAETGHQWRTSIRLNRSQIQQLGTLLDSVRADNSLLGRTDDMEG